MIKILVLNGSYRINGNTARTISLIEEQLQIEARQVGTDLSVEGVNLGHVNLQFCRGCRVCFDQGEDKCPLKDDLLVVKDKIQASDGVLIATPVYVNDVNGIMKNWIDRMAHVCHRPEFAGKCAFLLATVADGPVSHALSTLSMGLRTWGFHLVGQAGFKTGALTRREDIQVRYQKQIKKIASALFHSIHKRQYMQPSFFSLLTFYIQQRSWRKNANDSYDYRYWKSRGWIDEGQVFYNEQNAPRIKVALARFFGALLAPFVS